MVTNKPSFVYTGEKQNFNIKWFNQSKGYIAETDTHGNPHWIIKTGGERIDCYYTNINHLIDYVRCRTVAHGKGSDAQGIGRVYIKDTQSGEEVMVLKVEKLVHRYYEPVERFKHKERI